MSKAFAVAWTLTLTLSASPAIAQSFESSCRAAASSSNAVQEQALAEAEGALVALGYKPQEASKMLMKVADQCSTPEEMIRIALRNTMGGK